MRIFLAVVVWVVFGCSRPQRPEVVERKPAPEDVKVDVPSQEVTRTGPAAPDLASTPTGERPGLARVKPPETRPKRKPKRDITEGMVLIESGDFKMGWNATGWVDTRPVRFVHVDAFYIDKCEVTNKQWKEFLNATGYNWGGRMQAWPGGVLPKEMENLPVVYVNWYDAQAYAKWAGKRLPTEAEWEKAARGVDFRKYPWGNRFDKKLCNVAESGYKKVKPVGSFPTGASPYGCLDMCGNVAEWTADWYDAYPGNEKTLPQFGQRYRVIRGGHYNSTSGYETFARGYLEPTARLPYVGFRCVVSASKVKK